MGALVNYQNVTLRMPSVLFQYIHLTTTYLRFIWNTFCYYDKCLPMGESSSCQIFESFSCALQWVMETKYHAAGMPHFIDDFIFVGPPNSNKCVQDLHNFLSLCERDGMPIKEEKNCKSYFCPFCE